MCGDLGAGECFESLTADPEVLLSLRTVYISHFLILPVLEVLTLTLEYPAILRQKEVSGFLLSWLRFHCCAYTLWSQQLLV